MNAICILYPRKIRAFDLWYDAQLSNERALEKAFGLSILLAHEANSILDMGLGLAAALTPEH
jgi:hypothetical protein